MELNRFVFRVAISLGRVLLILALGLMGFVAWLLALMQWLNPTNLTLVNTMLDGRSVERSLPAAWVLLLIGLGLFVLTGLLVRGRAFKVKGLTQANTEEAA